MSGYRLTRTGTWVLTAVAAALYLVFNWLFADGLLTGAGAEEVAWYSSPVITWVLFLAIIAAGAYQASRLPESGLPLALPHDHVTPGQTDDPRWWRLLVGNVFVSMLWLPFRFFVGRDWFSHGMEKVVNPAWMDEGAALAGYWTRAVAIPEEGRPPITYDWYRNVLQYMLDNNWAPWFAKIVVWGEILIGIGIFVGALVGLAAFFGTVLNLSFGLAGTASTNPVLFGLSVLMVLAWRVAGWWGLDRIILPALGVRPNPVTVRSSAPANPVVPRNVPVD
jgi:thiosulfate dehydrogenase (quinone) large subunit